MNTDNLLLLGVKKSVTAISKQNGQTVWKTDLPGSFGTGFVTVLSDGELVFAHA